ncbi:MAG: hypothetical protein R2755_13600 [Acidimicrobiales bacterium]
MSSSFIGDPDIAGAYAYLRRGATPADRDALNGEAHPGLHLAGEAGSRLPRHAARCLVQR